MSFTQHIETMQMAPLLAFLIYSYLFSLGLEGYFVIGNTLLPYMYEMAPLLGFLLYLFGLCLEGVFS